MKKCPYCGKEYPDGAVRCLMDNELLPGGDPAPADPEAAVPPPLPVAAPPRGLTEGQFRLLELLLVCVIAFSSGLIVSLHSLADPEALLAGSGSASSAYRWIYAMLRQGSCLVLLWYVLRRGGRRFSDLGLRWAGWDVAWSVPLWWVAGLADQAVYHAIYAAGLTAEDHASTMARVGQYLFGNSVSSLVFLFQFLNPFFEELIVRAYVMTEVRQLTGSMGLAVFMSTALQTSYHFYQGVPAAVAHAAMFLIFSLYYAKTNRIAPVILAHLYMDVGATLFYAVHH